MHASNTEISTKPCSSCGAYSGGQRQFSCEPGRRIEQGPFRRAPRDARLSELVRENQRIQESMLASLEDAEP